MPHNISEIAFLATTSGHDFIYQGQTYTQPALIDSQGKIELCLPETSLSRLLLSHRCQAPQIIQLMSMSRPVPAIEQKKWVVWGQEYGIIFQWLPFQGVIEAFNSLTQENRPCQALLAPNSLSFPLFFQ